MSIPFVSALFLIPHIGGLLSNVTFGGPLPSYSEYSVFGAVVGIRIKMGIEIGIKMR